MTSDKKDKRMDNEQTSSPLSADLLIVDDNRENLRLLIQVFQDEGYNVRAVTDGPQALFAVRAKPPGLILLDVKLPGMEGYEVCRQLKNDVQTRDIPVIFISVADQVIDKVRAFSVGGVDYITKPFQIEEVLARVRTHLSAAQMQRQLVEKNQQLQQEIEERIRVEKALRESESRYQAQEQRIQRLARFPDENPNPVMRVDHTGKVLYANQASALLLDAWECQVGQSLPEAWCRFIFEVVNSAEKREAEVVHNDWVLSLTFAPIVEAGYVNIYGLDVTERVRAQDKLQAYSDQLEEMVSERTAEVQSQYAQMEAILSSVADAILLMDKDMYVRYVNPAFTKLTGFSSAEVIDTRANEMGAGAHSEATKDAIESILVKGAVWRGEVTSYRKDGRTYDAMLTVAPVLNAEGDLVGAVSSHQDISSTKALERARNQFITNVSHQFRTPITTLRLYIHLLERTQPTGQCGRYLQAMDEQISWLIRLIEDTLEMTALDSGKAVSSWEIVILPVLIDNAMVQHQHDIEEKSLAVEIAPFPSNLPTVKGDITRLSQALAEIVENAVMFTPPEGEVTLSVDADDDSERTWLRIAVRDSGPGIPPEELPRIFERFYRGHLMEPGHIPGTGLGLSIAQEIVHAHGGRITVESQVEQGAKFTIWLPAS